MNEPAWISQQVTLGNILVMLSMVANVGYQMRRLVGIEKGLESLSAQQAKDTNEMKAQQKRDSLEFERKLVNAAQVIESTYIRRDVQDVLMQSINQQLTALLLAQGELRVEIRGELRELRQQGMSGVVHP